MPDLPFRIRFVSPAFVGGAPSGAPKKLVILRKSENAGYSEVQVEAPYTPVDSCGLRIPSLRGVLDFWYRTLMPSSSGPEILQAQGEAFGSTELGQRLTIRSLGRPEFQAKELRFETQPFPMVYLGYGPLQLVRIPNGRSPSGHQIATSYNHLRCRDAIDVAPQTPEFSFVARGSQSSCKVLERALVLLHLFGGIGGRSRRGWGSAQVAGDFLPELPKEIPPGGLNTWFEARLREVSNEGSLPSGVTTRPRHSAFWSGVRIFLTTPQAGGYRAVLEDFYDRFAEVRLWRPPVGFSRSPIAQADHDGEEEDAGSPAKAISRVPERIAFGLPYQPRSGRGWGISYKGLTPDGEDISRRASPLFLKVFRLPDGRHIGVVLFLPSEFFGKPGTLLTATALRGPASAKAPFPGYPAVEALFDFSAYPRSGRMPWTAVPLP